MARRRLSAEEILELVQAEGSDIDDYSSSDEEADDIADDTTDDPAPIQRPQRLRGRRVDDHEEWIEGLAGYPDIPAFIGHPGLDIPDEAKSPLDFFYLFITPGRIRLFKSETNRYAADQIHSKQDAAPNSFFKLWKTVTLNEIRGFIAILIHMMVVKKPTLADYWSTSELLAQSFAPAIMPRNRFQAILSFFHLNDNDTFVASGQENHDRLHKVRPLYDHLRATCSKLYYPEKNLSIDEAICPWRGRLRFRVYMKDKPNRWGVKLYEICESSSGHVLDFEIYCGEPDRSNHPVDVSMRLIQPYLQKGHCLHTDDYYTCPELTETLLEQNTSSVGTVRSNRVGMPRVLQNETLRRGEVAYRRKEGVVALKWKDKKNVHILTTIHNPTEMVTVRSPTSEKEKPIAVHDYTQNMAGVDKSDQMMAYYPLRRKSVKWWKKVFFHLLTLSVVQSKILYNKSGRGRQLSIRDFIIELGTSLLNDYIQQKHDGDASSPSPRPNRALRLLSRCFPEPIPSTASKLRPARRCEVCSSKQIRRESTYMCSNCKVALCVHPCFKDYHTKTNFST